MRLAVAALVATLLFVSLGSAELVNARKREDSEAILGMTTRTYVDTFKKNEPAKAIASGTYTSTLGLYVFDADGNCVTSNDVSSAVTADDCAVEWIPPEQQRYSIEVRNGGYEVNVYQFALR